MLGGQIRRFQPINPLNRQSLTIEVERQPVLKVHIIVTPILTQVLLKRQVLLQLAEIQPKLINLIFYPLLQEDENHQHDQPIHM